MRFSELTACSCLHPDSNEPRNPRPCHIDLVIRFMPAVYRKLPLRIGHGGPDAQVGIEDAEIHFPYPYDAEGEISQDCRQWIIECVGDVAMKLGFAMCVVFKKKTDIVYFKANGDSFEGSKAPSGGLWL